VQLTQHTQGEFGQGVHGFLLTNLSINAQALAGGRFLLPAKHGCCIRISAARWKAVSVNWRKANRSSAQFPDVEAGTRLHRAAAGKVEGVQNKLIDAGTYLKDATVRTRPEGVQNFV
jgi:hypothetical protein